MDEDPKTEPETSQTAVPAPDSDIDISQLSAPDSSVPETREPTDESTPENSAEPSPSTDSTEAGDAPHPVDRQAFKPVVSPSHKNKKKQLFIVLLVVIVAAIAGFLGYKYLQKHKSQTTVNATEKAVQDVALIRYGTGEGNMGEFYPTLHNDDTTFYMNKQIFEGLVGFENKTKIVPVLAESWQNPDDTTWVFTLKSGVKFHNGDTLKAKDAVYSYQQILKNSDYADNFSTIKDVVAVDDTHVKVTTDGVDPILLNRMTGLLIVDSAAAGKADPAYGTGPYQLKSGTTPDAASIDLVAFDDYHGGHIYTRELQIKVYTDAEGKPGSAELAMAADAKAGKLDIVGLISGDNLALAKAAGLQLFPVDDVSVYQLVPNSTRKSSPLSNIKVRQAVYAAIDTDALMKALGRTGTAANQFLPSFIPGYDSTITRPKYDQAAAKQLLKDAGYPNGTSFTLTVFSGAQDAGQEIQRQLKDVGIIVKLDVQSDVSVLQARVTKGDFDALYAAQGSTFADASDVFAFNFGLPFYTNDQISKLMDQANSTIDQAKRLDLFKQISKLGMDDTATIPLYINQPNWAMNKPFVMTQDLLTSDLGVYFYKVHTK